MPIFIDVTIISMLIALVNILLSPFCILFFLFYASNKEQKYFTPDGTNVSKLKIVPYLIYCAIYLTVILFVTFLFTLFSSFGLTVWDVFTPKYFWISALSWGATVLTISTYLKGMEGNIMGFIYFPMLAFACVVLIGVNVSGVFSDKLDFDAPIIEYGFWTRFAMHAFLPVYVLLTLNTGNSAEEQRKDWIAPIVSSIIFQLFLFGANWSIVKVFGGQMTFSQYFGEGQNIVYYIPMAFGFLYYLFFFLSGSNWFSKYIARDTFVYILALVTFLMAAVETINYFRFMSTCF